MPRVTNYDLRSRVFQLDDKEGIYKYYLLCRRVEYCRLRNLPLPQVYHPEVDDDIIEFFQVFNPNEWSECERIYRSDKARRYRLRKKIRWLVSNYNAHFIRLGFWDSTFDKTTEKTRRRYVSRFLDSLNVPFVANIDYGEDYGREHYHAVVGCRIPLERMQFWYNTYGGFHSKCIRKSERSYLRLSKYVTKLCNHAVKYTCKRGSLLYSRKCPFPQSSSKSRPISAKVYFPSIGYTPFTPRTYNTKHYKSPHYPIYNCCVCGSLITTFSSSELLSHTSTRIKNGKSKKYYYCSECIKEYKIKIDKE